ncbi:MAG: hypothetical protein K2Q21_08615 [Chitinophagaceae bacterium]|nr:hypothetical protein [Chitinophagaceae bacterium]
MSDFNSIWEGWKDAAISGSLLTDKHDPNSASTQSCSYKTVLSNQISGSLEQLIVNKEFEKVEHFRYSQQPNKEFYLVQPKNFDVTGFARHTGSLIDAESCDRLRIYSGSVQGWHTCAETSSLSDLTISPCSIQLIETWNEF